MKRSYLIVWLAAVLLLAGVISGCGTTSAPPPALDLNPYTIEFSTEPAAPAAGSAVTLRAGITGKTPLSKRSAISFEVKKVGSDNRTEVQAESKAEGRYEAKYTFKEPGTYSITVHIISSSVHQVSNKEIEVK